MTQTHAPAEPEASAQPPATPGPALHLAYATPQPTRRADDLRYLVEAVLRRLIFAVGVGLLAGGIVSALAGPRRDDPATVAGVGAGMIALVVPFRKLSEPMRLDRNG